MGEWRPRGVGWWDGVVLRGCTTVVAPLGLDGVAVPLVPFLFPWMRGTT